MSKTLRTALVLTVFVTAVAGALSWKQHQLRHKAQDSPKTIEALSSPVPPEALQISGTATAPSSRVEANVEAEPLKSDPPTTNKRPLSPDEYPAYVEELRASGVSEHEIRKVVLADLREAFANDRRTLLTDTFGPHFWEGPDREAYAKFTRQKQEINDAMRHLLTDLLGEDADPPDDDLEWYRAQLDLRLDFLPEQKRDSTHEMLLTHRELDLQIKALSEANRSAITDDELLLGMLIEYEEKQAALLEILTREEFVEIEMRTSWTGDNLRRGMANFHPTEEEFRLIFKAWRPHDEELAFLYGTSKPDPGNAHVFKQIREGLPEERYQEYRNTWWK